MTNQENHDYKKHAADAMKYWGYTAGDGLPPASQIYFESYVASVVPEETEEGFFEEPMAMWESKLFRDDTIAMTVRESLVLSTNTNKCTTDERVWIYKRYLLGHFDAVSSHYLTVGRAFAYTPIEIKAQTSRKQFFVTPGRMDEVDIPSQYSSVGRRSVQKLEMKNFKLEGQGPNAVVGLRSKLPGSRFVKIQENGKTLLRGYRDIEVRADFEPELCEEWAGVMYILFPYGLETFSEKGETYMEHPWYTPSEFQMDSWSDGVMILTSGEEYRAKVCPTEEILDNGEVWEAAYGIRYGTGMNGLMLLRPRPGKKCISRDQATKVLKSVVPARDFMRWLVDCPETRPVSVATPGTYGRSVTITPERIWIDSGIARNLHVKSASPPREDSPPSERRRVKGGGGHQIPAQEEQLTPGFTSVKEQGIKSGWEDTPARIYGSKLVIVGHSPDTGSFPGIAIISEREYKDYDLPGGTRILGETPLMNLHREIEEELLMDPHSYHPRYLGKSLSERDKEGISAACADLYIVSVKGIPSRVANGLDWLTGHDVYKLTLGKGANVAQWVSRFLRFLQKMFPTVRDMLEFAESDQEIPSLTLYEEGDVTRWRQWLPSKVCPPSVLEWKVGNADKVFGLDSGSRIFSNREIPVEVKTRTPYLTGTRPAPLDCPCRGGRLSVTKHVPHCQWYLNQEAVALVVPTDIVDAVPSVLTGPGVPAGMPGPISIADLTTRDYKRLSSPQNSFYFIAKTLFSNPTLKTSKLYGEMRKNLNMGDLAAGRVVDELMKWGWVIKTATPGGDHVVSIPEIWKPL